MSREVRLDWDRIKRTGLGEAVMCENKTVAQLQHILDEIVASGETMLFTRLSENVAASLAVSSGILDYDSVSRTAICSPSVLNPDDRSDVIAIVSGGSADVSVVREAQRTLSCHGIRAQEIHDVGVAGLWRIQEHIGALARKQVIICVAGMDAALPTVLGGLVPALVIAVPTSTGYGTARGGETALSALLCSCAQGLVVVNIDNGFGAACAALRALRED